MNYHTRKATQEDMGQVLNLITELAVFEKEPDAVEITETDLKKKGFGSAAEFDCFVAEVDEKNRRGCFGIYSIFNMERDRFTS